MNQFFFPEKQPLETKFRDLLEELVDEKYYLKQETYEWFKKHNQECEEKKLGFRFSPVDREKAEIAKTITTHPGRTEVNYICEVQKIMDDRSNVRKLTPRESWRLMGFSDSDFNKVQAVNSNTQLYKQAGNSIVVNVLEAVLKNLLQESACETNNL